MYVAVPGFSELVDVVRTLNDAQVAKEQRNAALALDHMNAALAHDRAAMDG